MAKTASLVRKYNIPFGTQAQARAIFTALGEPHGKKGKLSKALPSIIRKQADVSQCREEARRIDKSDLDGYEPLNNKERTPFERYRRLHIVQFLKTRKPLMAHCKENKLPQGWLQTSYHQNNVYGTEKRGDLYFMIYRPWWRYTNYSWGRNRTHQYLAWTDGKSKAGVVRVKRQGSQVVGGIDSLKNSHVKKAEEKGYRVDTDWENKKFLVHLTRGMKIREYPFKKYSRERKDES